MNTPLMRALLALPLLAAHVKAKYAGQDLVVVSPDTGRVRMAEQWADELGGREIARQMADALQNKR